MIIGNGIGIGYNIGGQGYSEEALSYFTAVEDSGGVIDSSAKTAYNNFVSTLKGLTNSVSGNSEWDSIKELWLPIHNDNASLTPALVKAKYPAGKSASLTNTNFLAADYTKADGLRGDGSTKRYASDIVPNDLDYGNLHYGFGVNHFGVNATTNARILAAGATSFCLTTGSPASASIAAFYANNSFALSVNDQYPFNAGFEFVNVPSLSDMKIYRRGIMVPLASQTSLRTSAANANVLRGFSTGSGDYFGGSQWFYSIGTAFDPNNLSAIDTAFKSLLTALGRTYTEIMFEGDSLSVRGFNTPFTVRAVAELNAKYSLQVTAISGQTVSTMLANASSKYPDRLDSNSIYQLLGGINDLLSTARTAAEIWADILSLVQYVQSLGVTRIIVGTVTDSNNFDAADQTRRSDLNTLIRDNAATYGYTVMDLAATALGTYSATNFADASHWNNTGAAIAATVMKDAVLEVIS